MITRLRVTGAGLFALGMGAFFMSSHTKVDPEPISPGDTPAQMVNKPEASTSALYGDVGKALLGSSFAINVAAIGTNKVRDPSGEVPTNAPTPSSPPPPPGGFGGLDF